MATLRVNVAGFEVIVWSVLLWKMHAIVNVTIGLHDITLLLSWHHIYTQWHDLVLVEIQPVL